MTDRVLKPVAKNKFTAITVLVALVGLFFGLLVIYSFKMALMLLGASIALPVVYASVAYTKFGIIMLVLLECFIFMFIRIGSDFPLGTLIDFFQGLLILGFLLKQKKHANWKIYKNPVTVMITIWIIYNFAQVINPTASSILAWVYTIRSVAFSMLMYYIFLYNFNTKAYIKLIFKVWLGISVFVAVYAVNQEFNGFFAFEEVGLQSEKVRSLLFIDGHWRKFSIYSDPVVFSYNMVLAALICFGLLWRQMATYKKVILSLLCAFFLYVMLFSGTRGAYVLFPAALALFAILNFNKKVMVFSIIAVVFFIGIINMPTSNAYLVRFQTAFKPNDDPSFIVRKMNQKRIQPYIQSHPFGGGLGSVGVWGIRFAPDSYLAKFPPDSGYARIAVELGWIGLFLFCIVMFTVLRAGVVHFFAIRDPELKNYCMVTTLVIFALNIGNYPQEALTQFPSNVFFCMAIALVNATYLVDKQTEMTEIETK